MNMCQVSEVCGMYVCIYTYNTHMYHSLELIWSQNFRFGPPWTHFKYVKLISCLRSGKLLDMNHFNFPHNHSWLGGGFQHFLFLHLGEIIHILMSVFFTWVAQPPMRVSAKPCLCRKELLCKGDRFVWEAEQFLRPGAPVGGWMATWPTGWVKNSNELLDGHMFQFKQKLAEVWMVAGSYDIKTSRNTTMTTIRTIYHSNRQKQGMSLNGKNCNQ